MTVSARKTAALGLCLAAAAAAAFVSNDVNLFLAALIICTALRMSSMLVDVLRESEVRRRVARR